MRFSANLGFLWADRPLPDAIRAASAAGFDAVECHWPYDVPAAEMAAALAETGLPMLGLNTVRGDVAAGDAGLAALPDRRPAARAAIDQAIGYANAIGARSVHVMAGNASGAAARDCFVDNLRHACRAGAATGLTILIEPLNRYDAPGYFLHDNAQVPGIIDAVGHDNLRLMFDCYHAQLSGGDVTHQLQRLLPLIGHVQIAAVPDRGAPDHGELDYRHIYRLLADLGYDAPLGAEYRPSGRTEDSLGWLAAARA